MDRLYILVIILHLWIVVKKTFYCNDHTITEFRIIDSKNSSTAYVVLYELIDTWFLDSNRSTGENLDAVTAVTDSFKMADAFTGDRTGGAVARTNAQRVDISVTG